MTEDFIPALKEVAKLKGLNPEVLFKAVEDALLVAYKKKFGGTGAGVRVEINRETGETHMFIRQTVVEGEPASHEEISLAQVREWDEDFQVGDVLDQEIFLSSFGRNPALTAKHAIMQRIREAEQDHVNEYFQNMKNEVVLSLVQRKEGSCIYLDLGKADKIEGVLMRDEQIPRESYELHSKMKVFILDVKKSKNGPQVLVSRTHPGLVRKLFEREVPEISDGVVIVKSVSREPGSRSKIAVYTEDKEIDPVGSCVGPKGVRVQAVVDELRGEKMDIILYDEDPAKYVAAALSPSKVLKAEVSEKERVCRVVVPDNQLSLAIGKEGQNARLAAKLTGWKIDIKSESQAKAEQEAQEKVMGEQQDAPQGSEKGGSVTPE